MLTFGVWLVFVTGDCIKSFYVHRKIEIEKKNKEKRRIPLE